MDFVSIQPKPKTGLEEVMDDYHKKGIDSFNPAEAEDGFRSEGTILQLAPTRMGFNPAEAEDGFRSY